MDHTGYLSEIDWEAVRDYRRGNFLRLGLNASLKEYGNTRLDERLEWARCHEVDFYYSYKSREYVHERYGEILEQGYPILLLEFGANPWCITRVPKIKRDLKHFLRFDKSR